MSTYSANGRIVGEPQLKFLPSGTAACDLTVAVNHRKKNRDTGEWFDEGTTWIEVSILGEAAERHAGFFADKDLVLISGKLVSREFERKDGTKGSRIKLEFATVGKLPPRDPAPAPAAASTAAAWDAPVDRPF